jgi:sirohydrochlorin ferrochelatase
LRPRLVTVAHGTRHPTGNLVAAALTMAAGERLGVPATASYVELCEPSLPSVLAGAAGPTVVVPLLLTTGYHVRVDVPAAVTAASGVATVAPALGPDRLLATAQVDRLLSAGAEPGQPVVLVAAGSRDPAALPDLERAAALLGDAWGGPVRLATLGGRGRRAEDVVRPGDVLAPYLLAEGFFATRCAEIARSAGAVAAEVVGTHERVVELVVERFTAALSDLGTSG